jgi:hypothetical protein
MRLSALAPAALVLCVATPAIAQDWARFVSTEDGFSATFPGKPAVTTTTWDTEYRQKLPGRVYSAKDALGRYSTTVIDYRGIEKLHLDAVAKCRAAKGDGDSCQNDFRVDVAGAMDYAAWTLMRRDGVKTTQYMWYFLELVAGKLLQMTNPDQSRTFAVIHQHDGRLYIHQATVAARQPEPILFMQNLGFVDGKGINIRYKTFYTEGYGAEWQFPTTPRPPHTLRDQTADDYAP